MRVFVTGVGGQLGHDVMNELAGRGYEGIGSDIREVYSGCCDGTAAERMPYKQMDIIDAESVRNVLRSVRPDVVVHCAAWTAVDLAEDEDKWETVRMVNTSGTRTIAEVCRELDCKMVYFSTDYVFDGTGTEPWKPDCKDYRPLNVYGRTKLEGELAVAELLDKYFIVRIAWVFGKNGKNFIKTMLNLGKTHDRLTVVNDQIGNPTSTLVVAEGLRSILLTPEVVGTVHLTCEGEATWFDFAQEIFRLAGKSQKVIPCKTSEIPRPAPRPANSRLEKRMLKFYGLPAMPDWHEALREFMSEEF